MVVEHGPALAESCVDVIDPGRDLPDCVGSFEVLVGQIREGEFVDANRFIRRADVLEVALEVIDAHVGWRGAQTRLVKCCAYRFKVAVEWRMIARELNPIVAVACDPMDQFGHGVIQLPHAVDVDGSAYHDIHPRVTGFHSCGLRV